MTSARSQQGVLAGSFRARLLHPCACSLLHTCFPGASSLQAHHDFRNRTVKKPLASALREHLLHVQVPLYLPQAAP